MDNLYNQLNANFDTIFVVDEAIFLNPNLRHFFNDFEWKLFSATLSPETLSNSFVLADGKNKSSLKAENFCLEHNIKFVRVGDGFLRSFGLDSVEFPSLSIVLDDEGFYYDSSKPSRLEAIIQNHSLSRKMGIINKKNMLNFERLQLTKYNFCHTELNSDNFDVAKHQILVVGQADDDLSLTYGNGTHTNPIIISNNLRKQYPKAQINLKIHPDILSGKKKNNADLQNLHPSINVISENFNPSILISLMDEIHVITSQMGFEALLLNKEVHCHGTPFYAGWGLTIDHFNDEGVQQRRTNKPTIEELFHAVFDEYTLFKNPYKFNDNRFLTTTEVIENFEIEKFSEKTKNILLGKTLQKWEYSFLPYYIKGDCSNEEKLSDENIQIIFSNKNINIFTWSHERFDLIREYPFLKKSNVSLISVDNGFLRSISQYDEQATPRSLCFDHSGIHYDSELFTRNQLEHIIDNYDFATDPHLLLPLADKAIKKIIENGLSQYNNYPRNKTPYQPGFVLVICQLQNDSSLPYCSSTWMSNHELVKLAADENPELQIIIKFHSPDEHDQLSLTDNCIIDNQPISISSYLDECSKLYTINSIIGFEALLRNKEVTCCGNPFYSHRGLTRDKSSISFKRTKLSSVQLFVAAYIIYPTYFNPSSGEKTNILTAVNSLSEDIVKFHNSNFSEHKIETPNIIKILKKGRVILFELPKKVIKRFY